MPYEPAVSAAVRGMAERGNTSLLDQSLDRAQYCPMVAAEAIVDKQRKIRTLVAGITPYDWAQEEAAQWRKTRAYAGPPNEEGAESDPGSPILERDFELCSLKAEVRRLRGMLSCLPIHNRVQTNSYDS